MWASDLGPRRCVLSGVGTVRERPSTRANLTCAGARECGELAPNRPCRACNINIDLNIASDLLVLSTSSEAATVLYILAQLQPEAGFAKPSRVDSLTSARRVHCVVTVRTKVLCARDLESLNRGGGGSGGPGRNLLSLSLGLGAATSMPCAAIMQSSGLLWTSASVNSILLCWFTLPPASFFESSCARSTEGGREREREREKGGERELKTRLSSV